MLIWTSKRRKFIRFLFGDEDLGAMIDDERFGERITGLAPPRFDEYLLEENENSSGSSKESMDFFST